MQTELQDEHPLLDIHFVGVNLAGLESGNAQFVEDTNLPWLQDMDHNADTMSDAWADWGAGHLDLMILDGNNEPAGSANLITHGLDDPQNHAALREAVIEVAMMSQKPWHNADDPMDVNHSGFVSPLDVLMIINRLNATGSHKLPPPVGNQPPPPYYDTNADGDSTPLDVLLVINSLNARSAAADGEMEPSSQAMYPVAENAASPGVWQDWMSADTPSSDHATEHDANAIHELLPEPPDDESANPAAWQAQADRLFSSVRRDWRSFGSASSDVDFDLDPMSQLPTL